MFILIQVLFNHIQVHSKPCLCLLMLQCSEPFQKCISTHIQNPAIFIKIGKPSVTLKVQNAGILAILENSEP